MKFSNNNGAGGYVRVYYLFSWTFTSIWLFPCFRLRFTVVRRERFSRVYHTLKAHRDTTTACTFYAAANSYNIKTFIFRFVRERVDASEKSKATRFPEMFSGTYRVDNSYERFRIRSKKCKKTPFQSDNRPYWLTVCSTSKTVVIQ